MAEAFQLFTSALQVVDTTIKLIQFAEEVKDAPKTMQQVSVTLTSLRKVLEDLEKTSWIDGLAQLQEIFKSFWDDLNIICNSLQEYSGCQIGSQPTPQTAPKLPIKKRFKWVLFGTKEFEQALQRLDRYQSLFSLALDGHTHEAVVAGFSIMKDKQEETQRKLLEFEQTLGIIGNNQSNYLTRMETKDKKEEREKIESWLTSLEYETIQNSKNEKRAEGTGSWLLRDPLFQDWKAGKAPKNVLCCYGVPGAGKSFVTSAVVDHLEDFVEAEKKYAVAYIYCNYKDQDPKAEDYLASILKQLIQKRNELPDDVKAMYEKHHAKRTRPKISEISTPLKKLVESFERVYVVIDALDECRTTGITDHSITPGKLIGELKKLGNQLPLLVTSRPVPVIEGLFPETPSIQITAHEEDLRAYIRSYINSGNSRLNRQLSGKEELKASISDTIVEKSQGMFLLAELLLAYIGKQFTLNEIRKALASLPDTLDSVYDDLLSRVGNEQEEKERALKIFAWVALAIRPLNSQELLHAMAATDSSEMGYNEDDLGDEISLLDHCEGLVIKGGDGGIRFIHKSLQDYIVKKRDIGGISILDEFAAKSCIRYLLSPQIADALVHESGSRQINEGSPIGPEEVESLIKARRAEALRPHAFTSYAAHHWGYHVECVLDELEDSDVDQELDSLVTNLLFETPRALSVASIAVASLDEAEELDTPFEIGFLPDGTVSPLHVAAWHNLSVYVQKCVEERGYDVNTVDNEGNTALTLATYHDHVETVGVLMRQPEIDLNRENKYGFTALQYSISNPELMEIIQQYAETTGAFDVNAFNDMGETSLTVAAAEGSTREVERLLQNDELDPNKCNEEGWTPLSLAIRHQNFDVARSLLQREDVEINRSDENNWGFTPLVNAVVNENEDALALLFSRPDLDINKTDRSGSTPLHIAVQNQSPSIISLLLEQPGVSLQHRNAEGLTALELAERTGNIPIISMIRNRNQLHATSRGGIGPVDAYGRPLEGGIAHGGEAQGYYNSHHVAQSGPAPRFIPTHQHGNSHASAHGSHQTQHQHQYPAQSGVVADPHGSVQSVSYGSSVPTHHNQRATQTGVVYTGSHGHPQSATYGSPAPTYHQQNIQPGAIHVYTTHTEAPPPIYSAASTSQPTTVIYATETPTSTRQTQYSTESSAPHHQQSHHSGGSVEIELSLQNPQQQQKYYTAESEPQDGAQSPVQSPVAYPSQTRPTYAVDPDVAPTDQDEDGAAYQSASYTTQPAPRIRAVEENEELVSPVQVTGRGTFTAEEEQSGNVVPEDEETVKEGKSEDAETEESADDTKTEDAAATDDPVHEPETENPAGHDDPEADTKNEDAAGADDSDPVADTKAEDASDASGAEDPEAETKTEDAAGADSDSEADTNTEDATVTEESTEADTDGTTATEDVTGSDGEGTNKYSSNAGGYNIDDD